MMAPPIMPITSSCNQRLSVDPPLQHWSTDACQSPGSLFSPLVEEAHFGCGLCRACRRPPRHHPRNHIIEEPRPPPTYLSSSSPSSSSLQSLSPTSDLQHVQNQGTWTQPITPLVTDAPHFPLTNKEWFSVGGCWFEKAGVLRVSVSHLDERRD